MCTHSHKYDAHAQYVTRMFLDVCKPNYKYIGTHVCLCACSCVQMHAHVGACRYNCARILLFWVASFRRTRLEIAFIVQIFLLNI